MKAEDIVKSWKKAYYKGWKSKSKEKQLESLDLLIHAICMIAAKRLPIIRWGQQYKYVPEEMTIIQNENKPSILSALHETGHFLFGNKEEKASSWSIYIYQECFKNLSKKLK